MTEYHKKSIDELYRDFAKLENKGWKMERIYESYSRDPHNDFSFPIIGLHNRLTSTKIPALWIISGIHGEEPAGPNMIADNIDYIATNLKDIPALILPLCNPVGYHLGQRYLTENYEEEMTVGDCDHILLNKKGDNHRKIAKNMESVYIAKYLLKENIIRHPYAALDFHEDMKVHKGYIYSQGVKGVRDVLASMIIDSMKDSVHICGSEVTRWNENIINGIVAPVKDGSIDEFIASNHIYNNGKIELGIGARSVLVIETPALAYDLRIRVKAQESALHTAIEYMQRKWNKRK